MSNRVKLILGISLLFFIGILIAVAIGYFTSSADEAATDPGLAVEEAFKPVPSTSFVVARQVIEDESPELIMDSTQAIQEVDDIAEIRSTSNGAYLVEGSGSIYLYENGALKNVYSAESQIVFAAFSPDGSKVIIKTDQLLNFLVDLSSGDSVQLPSEIENIAWSPNGDKIAYQYVDVFDRINGLFIANPDASEFKSIQEFDSEDPTLRGVELLWPVRESVIWRPQSTGLDGTIVFSVDINSKDQTEITLNDTAFELIPGFDQGKIYYDVLLGGFENEVYRYEVKEYDLFSGQSKPVGLEASVSKCVSVPENKLVCATSESPDQPNSPELLIEYNVSSEKLTPLTEIDNDFPVTYNDMKYVADSNEIVYIDGISGTFSRISLN